MRDDIKISRIIEAILALILFATSIGSIKDTELTFKRLDGLEETVYNNDSRAFSMPLQFQYSDEESNHDMELILRILTQECGTDEELSLAVVQCLHNACVKDDWEHSLLQVMEMYQYTFPANYIAEEVASAYQKIFIDGETYKPVGNALYFYAPKYCTSSWHERQKFITEISGIRFFEEW